MVATLTTLFGQGGGGGGGGAVVLVIYLIVVVLAIAGVWKVFTKAGQPGWGCIVPIYNIYLILKIAGKPGWWLILFFIPIVGFIVMILVTVDLAKNFGKGVGFALGLIFLGFIFYPVLGFSDAQYQPQGR
jgi:hypothetical protein